MLFASGTQLGRYSIESLLGKGAMGEVYLARDTKLQRLVALKVLLPRKPNDPRSVRRFLTEARAASALNHPNVVHIYEIEEAEGVNFIALEYIDGETLRSRMSRTGMRPVEAVEIALQVCNAIAAAHKAKIIHRDIKPENIMLAGEGHVKVLDFGLAKLEVTPDREGIGATISQSESLSGMMIGTVSYMSPEQTRGQPLDQSTDIWSLGVVLYEVLTGRLPFEGDTSTDVIAAILTKTPVEVEQFSDESNEIANAILQKSLNKATDGRYKNIREMYTDLLELKQSLVDEYGDEELVPSLAGNTKTWSEPRFSHRSSTRSRSTRSQASAQADAPSVRTRKALVLAGVATLVVIAGVAVYENVWRKRVQPIQRPPKPLRRLTFDQGLQSGATWSPEGKFIAYSSNVNGNFDIWVQSINGGAPFQLTKNDDQEWQPDWSPDGNWIAYRSEREGGGIFKVPAPLGGQIQRISSFGYSPRWSPDGSRILFLSQGMRLYERPRVYVTNADGSATPTEILTTPSGDEGGVRRGTLAWHPDSQRVSYWSEDKRFKTVSINGGTPTTSEVDSGVADRIKQARVELGAFQWSPAGDALYFEGRADGLLNIWRIGVDPKTLRWITGPERLTSSEGQDSEIAVSRDGKKLLFTKKSQGTSIWLYTFDPQKGQLKDEGIALTPHDKDAWFPDLSSDGSKLLYVVFQQGMLKREIWEKSLKNSDVRKLLEVERDYPFYPRWSPDSSLIAFSPIVGLTNGKFSGSISLLNPTSTIAQPLSSVASASEVDPWRDYMSDWSRDGKWILASSDRGSPQRWYIAMFPVSGAPNAESEMKTIARDPESNLWSPRLSPDDKWICYLKQNPVETATSVLYVIPASGGEPLKLTDTDKWADKPRWSPDGKTIYFVYNRDSYFLNVWGLRFDPVDGKSVGEPFRITSLSSPSKMVATNLSSVDITLNKNRLALPVTEVSGNIWMIEDLEP